MKKIKLTYIISDINKALAFEWIASSLDHSKFSLSFILLNERESELAQYLSQNKIPCDEIIFSGKKDWPTVFLQLYRILKRNQPDIVHCHLLTASILGLSAAKLAGIKRRIYTRHHSDYHFRYFPKGVKWDKWCNKLATKIIAPSIAVQNVLVNMEKVSEEKVIVVNHGFDLQYFRNVPTEIAQKIKLKYNPDKKYPVIGVISRFTELKGIQFIIPAFQKILLQYPDALLLLFNASGDYKAQIDDQLSKLPKESYQAIAFENELAAVYSLFNVFVQVSTDTNIESFGQTYIEALASGVPSVFTLAGVSSDFIVHRENAIVVPFKNSEAIFEAILQILTDNELKNKIIKGGWNSVIDRFSLHKMMENLNEVYSVK